MTGHDIPTLQDELFESDHLELSSLHSPLSVSFFSGANRGYLVGLLRFLLEYVPQPIVVTGGSGIGKTVLLSEIANQAPETWRICRVSAAEVVTPQEVYHELLRQLELPVPQGAALTMQAVVDRLYKLERAGCLPVLLYDDAQLLRTEVVEQVLQLSLTPENQAQPPLRIALFGFEYLAGQVAGMGDEFTVRHIRMLPFNEAQAREYIAFRRNDTPENVSRLLSPEQLSELMAQTQGLPNKINQWLDRGGTVKLAQPHRKPVSHVFKWIGITSVVVFFVVILLFQNQINQQLEVDAPSERSIERVVDLPLLAPHPSVPVQIDTPPAPEVPAEDFVVAEPLEIAPSAPDEVTPASTEEAPMAEMPPEPAVDFSVDATPAAGEIVEAAITSPGPQQAAAAPPDPVADGIRREDWILAQHQEAYTVRIMSVRNESSLKEYIKNKGLVEQVAYYKALRSSGVWYVMIYGLYPTESKAKAALTEVESRLGIKKPLLGQFHELQGDIKKTRAASR